MKAREQTRVGPLSWHHTEFGRRTDCGSYRIVHRGAGWQLLDADWNPLAAAGPSIEAAQQLAARLAARSAATVLATGTENR